MRREEEKRNPAVARIAPLEPGDVERVSALAREIWFEHYPGIISVAQIEYMLAQRYESRVIAAELGRDDLWWYALRVDSEIVAFASCFLGEPPGTMKLDKLYVQAQQRRRGHGALLIGQVCAVARARGCDRIVLAVNKRNSDAIAAYRRCGFVVRASAVKDIGGGYVMDDYIMVLPLTK